MTASVNAVSPNTSLAWLRLSRWNSVGNESEALPGDVAGACDLSSRVDAPHAGVRSFYTIQRSEGRPFSEKSMGVSILADERADDLSAVIYPISGRAIWKTRTRDRQWIGPCPNFRRCRHAS